MKSLSKKFSLSFADFLTALERGCRRPAYTDRQMLMIFPQIPDYDDLYTLPHPLTACCRSGSILLLCDIVFFNKVWDAKHDPAQAAEYSEIEPIGDITLQTMRDLSGQIEVVAAAITLSSIKYPAGHPAPVAFYYSSFLGDLTVSDPAFREFRLEVNVPKLLNDYAEVKAAAAAKGENETAKISFADFTKEQQKEFSKVWDDLGYYTADAKEGSDCPFCAPWQWCTWKFDAAQVQHMRRLVQEYYRRYLPDIYEEHLADARSYAEQGYTLDNFEKLDCRTQWEKEKDKLEHQAEQLNVRINQVPTKIIFNLCIIEENELQ